MSSLTEANERMQREKMAAANRECGDAENIPAPSSFGYDYTQANAVQGTAPLDQWPSVPIAGHTFTLKEEAEKRYRDHSQQMQKAQQAFDFLSANPAFDEFVRLVRAGVIQF